MQLVSNNDIRRTFVSIINYEKKKSKEILAMISQQRQNVFPDDNIRFTCKQNGTMKFSYSG